MKNYIFHYFGDTALFGCENRSGRFASSSLSSFPFLNIVASWINIVSIFVVEVRFEYTGANFEVVYFTDLAIVMSLT